MHDGPYSSVWACCWPISLSLLGTKFPLILKIDIRIVKILSISDPVRRIKHLLDIVVCIQTFINPVLHTLSGDTEGECFISIKHGPLEYMLILIPQKTWNNGHFETVLLD